MYFGHGKAKTKVEIIFPDELRDNAQFYICKVKIEKNASTINVSNVLILGDTNSGKSTTIGVMKSGKIDDGEGKA